MDFPVGSSSRTSHKVGSVFRASVTGVDPPRRWSSSLAAQDVVMHVTSLIGSSYLLSFNRYESSEQLMIKCIRLPKARLPSENPSSEFCTCTPWCYLLA